MQGATCRDALRLVLLVNSRYESDGHHLIPLTHILTAVTSASTTVPGGVDVLQWAIQLVL